MKPGAMSCVRWFACVLALTCVVSCEDEPQRVGRGGTAATPAAGAAPAKGAAGDPKKAAGPVVYVDDDFVESVRNRDPFVSYTQEFSAKPPTDVQRPVVMPSTAVEEMQLIAIVTGMPQPKAMLLDPMGMGHVVERGDYLGRPKVIQASGNVAMTLNWRVDRIRDNEVVLTQQDPVDPTRTALTKVISLNAEVADRSQPGFNLAR